MELETEYMTKQVYRIANHYKPEFSDDAQLYVFSCWRQIQQKRGGGGLSSFALKGRNVLSFLLTEVRKCVPPPLRMHTSLYTIQAAEILIKMAWNGRKGKL
jgi:hypothetical protein